MEDFNIKKSTYVTTRFDVDGEYNEFYVEVIPNKDMYDFVLCMEGYGLNLVCNEVVAGLYKEGHTLDATPKASNRLNSRFYM